MTPPSSVNCVTTFFTLPSMTMESRCCRYFDTLVDSSVFNLPVFDLSAFDLSAFDFDVVGLTPASDAGEVR